MAEKSENKSASLIERAGGALGNSSEASPPVRRDKADPTVLSKSTTEATSASAGDGSEDAKGDEQTVFRGLGGKKTGDGGDPKAASPGVEPAAKIIERTNDSEVGTGSVPAPDKAQAPARKVQELDLAALRDAGYITPDMPPNLMSEEFRIIKRSLLLKAFAKGKSSQKNSNIILVTSSSPGEGKTFCAINLALSIATEQDVTVLLVDADFSKPEVLNRLGASGGRGLMDVVADKNLDIGECLVRTNIPNLVLLPAGRQHNLTTELLASDRMEAIVDQIAKRYEDRIIIFDSPPVLASSAASVLALYMGQAAFIIEAEKTTEPQIKESISMISACPNINLVLNKTQYSGSNKKFATYYGYGGR